MSAPGTSGLVWGSENMRPDMSHFMTYKWLINYESASSTETKTRQIFSTFSIIKIRFVEGFCSIFHCFLVFIPEISFWSSAESAHPDLPNRATNQRTSYQVKSDLLEFGDSVVLSPRRIDPRADRGGRPLWFFAVGVVSLAIRYELNRCTDAVTTRPSCRVFAEFNGRL